MIGEVQGVSEDCGFGYQAPDVLLDSQLGPGADIWNPACLVRITAFFPADSRMTICEDLGGFDRSGVLLSWPNKI